MRLQTSFRDQHPSWVPTTGKASLLTTNQSCLSQVLVKLAPLFKEENLRNIWKSNSSRAMECWIRSEIWRETWATVPALAILWGPCVPGQNPVRHCVEELCKLSSVAGVPHWAEALPQASHFVLSNSFLPSSCKMLSFYISWSPSLAKCQPLSSCLHQSPHAPWCQLDTWPKSRLLPPESRQTKRGLFWVFLLEREFGAYASLLKLVKMYRRNLNKSCMFHCHLGTMLALFSTMTSEILISLRTWGVSP